ncbi:threonine ammonia-lyase [Granulicoccus sp. GXG6511]|uniref:threonine ammonia-lyase n=1 Tax=Granulicoccus sp. GXG6511 TaxID=3381351 RepID=UPI003D7E40CE
MAKVPTVSIDEVRAARELLADVISATPMERSGALSARIGAETYLKCENLQRAGSFKIRGAYTRMSRLSPEERERGVVAASAGNHAQGVALAAQLLGIRSKVYMPVGAPMPKLAATRAYGAEVEQVGATLDESLDAAEDYAERTGAVLIHPFDHADIVAGQGTCGLEILEQCPDVQTIVVGLGGGGLLAGIAVVARALRPDVRIIGVQAEQAAAYPHSLEVGEPVAAERMATMADGIAVGLPGDVTFPLVRDLVDEVVTVSEESLARAALFLLERAKLVVEPAGAASVAHLMSRAADPLPGPVVAVLSGGNIDPLLLMRIIRHGMAVAGRFLQVAVVAPDAPGALSGLLAEVADTRANVVDVGHLRTGTNLRVDQVEIDLVLETRNREHQREVLERLREKGYEVRQ